MNTDTERMIYGLHRQGQDKFTYFLLAAAGASVAFAITQTKTAALSTSHVPLGLAIAAWALSFYCGCQFLRFMDSQLQGNMELIKMQTGRHPDLGTNPENMAWGSKTLKELLEKAGGKAQGYSRWQFRWLALGAGSYIAWHVYEMHLRSMPAN